MDKKNIKESRLETFPQGAVILFMVVGAKFMRSWSIDYTFGWRWNFYQFVSELLWYLERVKRLIDLAITRSWN